MGTLDNINPVGSLGASDSISQIITTTNENGTVTNALLAAGQVLQDQSDVIGDLSTLSSGLTLVDQSNYAYNNITDALNAAGFVVEFCPSAPVVTGDEAQPPFYFDTTFQTFMVWNQGDQRYYQAFGCNSIVDSVAPAANDWKTVAVVEPPVIPPVVCPIDCVTFNPPIPENSSVVRHTFDTYQDILAATFECNTIHYMVKTSDGAEYHQYDFATGTGIIVGTVPYCFHGGKLIRSQDTNNLFWVGGTTSTGLPNTNIIRISQLNGVFATVGTLPIPLLSGHSVTYSANETIAYIFGGVTLSGGSAVMSNTIFALELMTGAISQVGTLPVGLSGIGTLEFVNSNGCVYLFGGRLSNDPRNLSLSDNVLKFDVVTGTITQVATLPEGRSDMIVYSGAGSYFIAGGIGEGAGGCVMRTNCVIEIFPFGSTWSSIDKGKLGLNDLDHWGASYAGCGYGAYLSNNGTSSATLNFFNLD